MSFCELLRRISPIQCPFYCVPTARPFSRDTVEDSGCLYDKAAVLIDTIKGTPVLTGAKYARVFGF
jgi:hypothetical protein